MSNDPNGSATTAAASSNEGAASVDAKPKTPRDVAVLLFIRDRGVFILWALIYLGFNYLARPYFFGLDNFLLISGAAALTAIFAAGVAIGAIGGALDLSLPGVAAFAGIFVAKLLQHNINPWIAIALGCVSGIIFGIFNGVVTLRGLNPLVVTIGTFSILTGIATIIAKGYTIPGLDALHFIGTDSYNLNVFAAHQKVGAWPVIGDLLHSGALKGFRESGFMVKLTHASIPVPSQVYVAVLIYIVGTVFLTKTREGVRLMAVGANAEAVRRAGVNSSLYTIMGFAISGLLSAVGGICLAAGVTEADPKGDAQLIFQALTAVALAGVSLAGGRGSLPRVLIGALILATIQNGLILMGVDPYAGTVATGSLLIGALALDKYLSVVVASRLVTSSGKK